MSHSTWFRRVAVVAGLLASSSLGAQQPASTAPKVGDVAPDFTIRVATKDGVQKVPFRLADAKGSTVVLAFFPKARTGG